MPVRNYRYSQVDAFTTERYSGNPCAIVLDADDLTDLEMQKIAKEMNLSETSYVMSSSDADFKFRYFTPAVEIPLAGHPTIATIHRLVELGKITENTELVKIELQAGIVDVEINRATSPITVTMKQLAPQFMGQYLPAEILPVFGLTEEDVETGGPLQTVSTGAPMLMVPLKDYSALKSIQLDANGLKELCQQSDFFGVHLFALGEGEVFARNFCPPPDVVEDPFTGSAAGAMGCYLWHYGMIKQPEIWVNQGSFLARPGRGKLQVLGDRNDILGVKISGQAVTCMEGSLII